MRLWVRWQVCVSITQAREGTSGLTVRDRYGVAGHVG